MTGLKTYFVNFQMSLWIDRMRFPLRYKYLIECSSSNWLGNRVSMFPLKFNSRNWPNFDFDANVFGSDSFVRRLFFAINVLNGHSINISKFNVAKLLLLISNVWRFANFNNESGRLDRWLLYNIMVSISAYELSLLNKFKKLSSTFDNVKLRFW